MGECLDSDKWYYWLVILTFKTLVHVFFECKRIHHRLTTISLEVLGKVSEKTMKIYTRVPVRTHTAYNS